jgi:sugar O-acyltransferase (sialic acid O-acetyltransferase NeuD family)
MASILRAPVLIVGGGGHAQVVAEAALTDREVVGFLDDDAEATMPMLGAARLGAIRDFSPDLAPLFVVGLGDNALRQRTHEACCAAGGSDAQPVDILHPSASISATSQWFGGAFAGPGSVVHTGAVIGRGAIVNSGAVVEHDCRIGEFAHIAPGAVLGGNVQVGALALVGLGARVLPGVRIGAAAVVGAGAVVVTDVPEATTVVGVPARS